MQTSTRCRPDRLQVVHVVEGRDGHAVGGRLLERLGDLAERLGREPAVALLREPQRRQRRRARHRVARAHLLDLVVERLSLGRAHRSTSPMTASSEPTIAIRSATAASGHAGGGGVQRRERRRAELHPPRLRPAVGDEVAARLAARGLDPDVDLALGDAEALGDDLEVVDQRLHRGVQLLARRQHDLAVVGDPRLALHPLEPVDALGDDPRRLAHLVDADAVAVVDVAAVVDGHVEVDLGRRRGTARACAGPSRRRTRAASAPSARARSRPRPRAGRRPPCARARSCSS